MEEIKNIFDYATKELSQDAFLMWLCANYDCKDDILRDASRSYIEWTSGISKDAEIKDLRIWAQWCKIDVTIYITLEDGTTIGLFVEDKTTSREHNQLKKYNRYINY